MTLLSGQAASIPTSVRLKLLSALDEAAIASPVKVQTFVESLGGTLDSIGALREANAQIKPIVLQVLSAIESLLSELQVAWADGFTEGLENAVHNVVSLVSLAVIAEPGVSQQVRMHATEVLLTLAGDTAALLAQDDQSHRVLCRNLLRLHASIDQDGLAIHQRAEDSGVQVAAFDDEWPLPLPAFASSVTEGLDRKVFNAFAANSLIEDVERLGTTRIDSRLEMLSSASSPYRVLGEIQKCLQILTSDARKCGCTAVIQATEWLNECLVEIETSREAWSRDALKRAIEGVFSKIRAWAKELEYVRNVAIDEAPAQEVEVLAETSIREQVCSDMHDDILVDDGEPVIWIGPVCVPEWLYDTAQPELSGLGDDLREATERLHSLQISISEWIRIPHTIGGIAANLRIERLREAAESLELWAAIEGARTAETGFVLPPEEVDRLVLYVLDAIAAVSRREMPDDPALLIAGLDLAAPPVKIAGETDLAEGNSEIFAIFVDEAQDLAAKIESALRAGNVKSVKATLHTLKSSARIAGFSEFGRTAHDLESRLGHATAIQPDNAMAVRALLASLDAIIRKTDGQSQGAETLFVRVPRNDLSELLVRVGETQNAILSATAFLPAMLQDVDGLRRCVSDLSDLAREMTTIGETSIHSHMDAGHPTLRGGLSDPLEFDRFTKLQEIARRVSERLDDVLSHRNGIESRAGSILELLDAGRRANETTRDRLMTLRAVSFASLSDRFRRVIDLAARESGKLAYFDLEEDAPIDAGMQRDIAPLIEHLVRNAVIHGVERPADRILCGKPQIGRVAMRVRRVENAVSIEIEDDGKGASLEVLRRKANLPDGATEKDVLDVLFHSGFSTAEKVTHEAGRGVGLSAVRDGVERIGGSVSVTSNPGRGMVFTLRLPSESDFMNVMLIGVAGEKVALPARNITTIHSIGFSDAQQALAKGEYSLPDGRTLPIALLGHALRLERRQDISRILGSTSRMLELEVGDRHMLYVVDGEIQQTRNVQYRAMSHLATIIPGIMGLATIEGGRIAPIIHPILFGGAGRSRPVDQPKRERMMRVLVVDDSITVRKATVRSIGRHGYKMIEARDGQEALEIIERDGAPDIILLDIEMPRMDGFMFAEVLRGRDWDAKSVPIIMISSRVVEKYRDQAASLGVNQCMGKPFSETELLASIKELT